QNHLDAAQHLLTGLGHPLDAFAVAGEDLDAQFVLQLDDGLGDARLGGMQCLGRLGEVEVAAHRLLDKAKLVQVHGGTAPSRAIEASRRVSRCCAPAAGRQLMRIPGWRSRNASTSTGRSSRAWRPMPMNAGRILSSVAPCAIRWLAQSARPGSESSR